MKTDLSNLRHRYNIPKGVDFHTLPSNVVERIVSAAKEYGYRKPRNANGSTARYFYSFMERGAK